MWQYQSDHYRLQRLALLPTADSLPISELHSALLRLSEAEQRQLLALILNQGLQFFWLEALRELPDLSFAAAWREQLKEQCFRNTTRYLAQKKALIELDRLFEEEQIPYAVFKGAHIREVVYPNPAYRPSVDIDLLVSPDEKIRAVHSLCANGYTLFPDPANVSHEVGLAKDNVHLDLHWHIMRPGRTRIELTALFLQSRQRCGFFWGLDNDMTLLVLLAHPVFTKYSTAPQSSIVRLADLRKWLERREIDWQRLLHLLEDSGLKTAAWITATILTDLTGYRLPAFVYEAISPTHPKRYLLKKWLDLNLSSKFADYPIIPKYIFTLLAHDRWRDMINFIKIYREEQKKAGEILGEIRQASTVVADSSRIKLI
ncbi:MAG: nucleotidyltransferase family protein [Desulfoprunum sp.]|nr:nucleotidyltransferase family protein [Desulfoprunum sp.]